MNLTRLALRNFRTYSSLQIEFAPGINLILGPNASGKTNLAEAVYYLSLARSWRTPTDRALIKDDEAMAEIAADLMEGDLHRSLEFQLSKEGKRIRLNHKPVRRLSDLCKVANVVLFAPSDVGLFAGAPAERRSYLDIAISKQSNDYFALISRYSHLLKERNAALKATIPNVELIRTFAQQMAELTAPIISYRMMFVSSLNEVLPTIYGRLSGQTAACKAVYRPFIKGNDISPERVNDEFEAALDGDLAHRATGIGVHREDFGLTLNGDDIAVYGSQGENRTAVIALKLAPYFLVESPAKKPIAVLDDVTSELDSDRVHRLFELLRGLGQVFVTATELDIEGASIIDVASNNANRRI